MKIQGRTLLKIDTLFRLLYVLSAKIVQWFAIVPRTSEKIVVIKFMGLGSIVQIDNVFEKLSIDRSKITLLTLEKNHQLNTLTGFHNTMYIRTNDPIAFLIDCIKTIKIIRQLRPSLIVDYERCSFSASFFRNVIALISRCKTISFEQNAAKTTHRQTIYNVDEFNQEQLFTKGAEQLPRSAHSVRVIPLKEGKRSQKVLININVSNYLLLRRYPANLFADVIRELHAWDSTLIFCLTGSPEEREYVESFKIKLSGLPVENFAGIWSLEKFHAELSHCRLFITGDSGPLHIAIGTSTPTIAIWGPTQPEHFGYTNIPHLHNITLRLPCSPCFTHPRSSPAISCNQKATCLTQLPAAAIIEKSLMILGTPLLPGPTFKVASEPIVSLTEV